MLSTENGIPLCQNIVPDTCQPFSYVPKGVASHLYRQSVDVLSREVVSDVVIARTIIASQFSRQRRENPTRRKLKEPAVRYCVQAMTPSVVDLPLQPVTPGAS